MRLAACALALTVLAGCVGGAPPLALRGEACSEVALLVAGDPAEAARLLPAGLRAADAAGTRPGLPPGRPAVVVAVNHCAFTTGEVRWRGAEAFAWVLLQEPAHLALGPNASYAYEAYRWLPPGPALEALRGWLPRAAPAGFEGLPEGFRAGRPFNVTVRASAGSLELTGLAAEPRQVLDHPEAPCCRTFAAGPEGLARTDYTATDQPWGEAPCALRTDHSGLRLLLGGASAGGSCVHNSPYDFHARVGPAA